LKKNNLNTNDELFLAERLIDKNPLPDKVLYMMTKYDYATTKICDDILDAAGLVQHQIHELLIKYTPKPEEIINILSEGLKKPVLSLNRNYVNAVSIDRVNEAINNYVDLTTLGLYDKLHKHFSIDKGFKKIYSNALRNKSLFFTP
jgi:hypothetical protein